MTWLKCPACGGLVSLKLGKCLPCGRPFVPETDAAFTAVGASETAAVAMFTLDEAWSSAEPRPWIRYFARSIDGVIAVALVLVLLSLFAPSMAGTPDLLVAVAGLFLWIFIEPLFLTRFGATPGKALLGTRVQSSTGENLSYATALERSGAVWLRGLGMGLPGVSLITMLVAYLRLADAERSSWDEELDTYVEHRPMSNLRVVAAVLVLLMVFALRFADVVLAGNNVR